MTDRLKVSVVLPFRNAGTTVQRTLDSLLVQRPRCDELIVVDDGSTDDSFEIVKTSLHDCAFPVKFVRNVKSMGLAQSYNAGITTCSGEIVVILHSDVSLIGTDALSKLVEPLLSDKSVVASYHYVDHPYDLWKQYNFWQKCLFARIIGVREYGLDGKFDAFRKTDLLAVGMFDGITFARAGEDGDIFRKLNSRGRLEKTEAGILHFHSMDVNFSPRAVIFKNAQYAEAQGAICRRYGILNLKEFLRAFFRELMIIGLLFPYLRILSLLAICMYVFLYTWRVYAEEWRNPRVILLPFLNACTLIVSSVFTIRGFITGKQRL